MLSCVSDGLCVCSLVTLVVLCVFHLLRFVFTSGSAVLVLLAGLGPMTSCDLELASAALANYTDLCDVFVRCPAVQRPSDRCAALPAAFPDVITGIQSAYGTFREVYASLAVAGSDGIPAAAAFGGKSRRRDKQQEPLPPPKPPLTDVPLAEITPWATVSRPLGCGRRIDLVMRHTESYDDPPLFAPLSQLLARSPAGVCVRVILYERPRSPASAATPADLDSAFDARDALFSIRRVQRPPGTDDLAGLVEAHRQLLGRDAAATTTVFVSHTSALTPPYLIDSWCHARTLLSHAFGATAVRLASPLSRLRGGDLVLRYSAAALANASRASVVAASESGAAAPLEAVCSRPRGGIGIVNALNRQALTRAMSMLLVQSAELVRRAVAADGGQADGGNRLERSRAAWAAAGRLSARPEGSARAALGASRTFGRTLGQTRPPLGAAPLACLASDFTRFNRELSFDGAAAAVAACEPAAVAASAASTLELLAYMRAAQNGTAPADTLGRRGGGRDSRQRMNLLGQCAPKRLVAVKPHPSGFFSLLHGLIKPLTHSLRKGHVMLTPRVLEFTSAKQVLTRGNNLALSLTADLPALL